MTTTLPEADAHTLLPQICRGLHVSSMLVEMRQVGYDRVLLGQYEVLAFLTRSSTVITGRV